MTALCESASESADSVVNQIAQSKTIVPEMRGYWLLRLADACLKGRDRAELDSQFKGISKAPWANSFFRNPRMKGIFLTRWANEVALAERRKPATPNKATSDSLSTLRENTPLAHEAIDKALAQLEQSSDTFAKMNLYFIASQLFQKMGDTKGFQKCNKILARALEDCESNSEPDEARVKASLSILNSMAYSLISVEVPDQVEDLARPPAFTEQDFKECQKLKLRGLAIADRLKPGTHERRKAHRDLVIWYFELGKVDLAEEAKQSLFALFGSKNEGILYPQRGMCGEFIWWETEVVGYAGDCGMG